MDIRKYIIDNFTFGQIQLDFLDSIDFLPMMKDKINIEDIMSDIEDKYDYGYMRDKLPLELNGCAFNYIDTYEFGLYLADRYPEWKIEECNKVWYELRKKV